MTTQKSNSLEHTPHVHAEMIKAWADGAIIECQIGNSEWHPAANPMWCTNTNYRVKPEPKPDFSKFIGVGYESDWGYAHTTGVYGHEEFVCKSFEDKDEYWTNTDIIELVYDGETEQLKNVILKGKAK